ncbi:epidermal growth factor-like protein 6 [Ambystoma mexicanum]|uniref:epidermal growth factor-like protein 6 n=1 Tax=Ambystoma mexicanum TaxID=8296 RepID=UPI0037E9BD60
MGPVLWATWLSVLLPLASGRLADASSLRSRRQFSAANHPGVCRYGSKMDCCYGWKRNSKGHCEAVCEQGCKYGECMGANKCKCFPGFTGKSCNQDVNECGQKPRPCEHRCMNTHGSYKCYCLNGYMLMPDGSCANSRSCAMANCQYGCEEVKGEVRCLCPSTGLQLGPDGRTCVDIDECSSSKALCPFNRRCVNTFGSYYCKCQIGYELKYVNGRYDCLDINECTMNTDKCSLHADCLNTQGSFKCKCKQGYRGSGMECSLIPENSVKEGPKISASAKDTLKKLLAHKNSLKRNEDTKNLIPEVAVTPPSKIRLQPFDYEDGVYVGSDNNELEKEPEDAEDDDEEESLVDEDEGEEEDDIENYSEKKLRGDVFAPLVKEAAAFAPLAEHRSIPGTAPEQTGLSIDCSFDRGACDWKQDPEDDFDWSPADRINGEGYYMAVPSFVGQKKDIGRLQLPLIGLRPQGKFCLTFTYRISGERVGKLRLFLGQSTTPVWEHSRGRDEGWKAARIEVPSSNSESITFESERGKGKTGEIGLDSVLLVSGPCHDSHSAVDI